MKVLLINGSPHPRGCTYTALSEIQIMLELNGVETELYHIGTKPISGCLGCNACFKARKCVLDDGVNEIAARLDEFDGIVVGSPVYFASASGQLCCFLDRLFYSAARKMTGKVGAAVVSCRRAGSSAAFDRLNKYFTYAKMNVIGSQYWNQVHGYTPDDVRKDLEGLQTMRTLAQNMAWTLKAIQAAKEAGITEPHYERIVRTNFID